MDRLKANTLVEFRLENAPDVTRVRLVERGFAALPTEIAAFCVMDHPGGLTYLLDRLSDLLE